MKFSTALSAIALLIGVAAAAPDCSQQFQCLANYEPVCGSDGKTYPNECAMNQAYCDAEKNNSTAPTLAHTGECTESTPTPTPTPALTPTPTPTPTPTAKPTACAVACPEIYRPVCGSDGTTYGNDCFLHAAACKNPTLNLTKAHDGECQA